MVWQAEGWHESLKPGPVAVFWQQMQSCIPNTDGPILNLWSYYWSVLCPEWSRQDLGELESGAWSPIATKMPSIK